jgi:hypothetical protein
MTSRTSWSDFELQAVVDAGLRLAANSNRSLLSARLLAQAQTCLPPERRLSPSTVLNVRTWNRRLHAAFLEANLLYPHHRETSRVKPCNVKVEDPAGVAPQQKLDDAQRALDAARIEQLAESSFEDLYAALAYKLRMMVEAKVAESISTSLRDLSQGLGEFALHPEVVLHPSSTKVESIPRVLICGLLPLQANLVKERASNLRAEFRFFEGSPSNLRVNAQWSDHIFLMTKFTDHPRQHILKSCGKTLHYVNGGVTGLLQLVHRTLSELNSTNLVNTK